MLIKMSNNKDIKKQDKFMKISVALASFNGEKFIKQQLLSIINQTRKVDEIIISDDGSTDSTIALIKEIMGKYDIVYTILNNSNHGVVHNFYNAFKYTSGDVVVLCDQDDIWMPNKIEEIEKVFFDESIKCLNTSFDYIDEFGKKIIVENKKKFSNNNLICMEIKSNNIVEIPLELVFHKNISPGMTMAVRKEIIDTYIVHTQQEYIHDWELNCIAASLNGLYFFNKKLSHYRIHSLQTISISSLKKEGRLKQIKRKIVQVKKSLMSQINLLNELFVISNDDKKSFINDVKQMYLTRYKVAVEHKIYLFFKEIFLFVKIKKKYNYIDIRYLLIDFFACFKK